jgi:hypothetical protein
VNGSKLTILTAITGVMALGEFATAAMIGLGEDGPDRAGSPAVAVFGVLFLIAAWLLRSGRIIAGAVFVGILCLFTVLSYPSYYKHSVLNWTWDTVFALVAMVGLVGTIVVLVGRFRHRAVA